MLSKLTTSVLVDLIENKLAMLQIGDRDDLREVLTLQRCLSELRGVIAGETQAAGEAIPHRGRHRKLTALMDDAQITPELRQRMA